MSARRADIVARLQVRMPYGRQAVWDALRELPEATATQLYERCGYQRDSIVSYLRLLRMAGFVEATPIGAAGPGKPQQWLYRLVIDQPEAPIVREDGSVAPPVGRAYDHMWRSMKAIGTFSIRELMAAATTDDVSVSYAGARRYITHLHKAGYLTRTSHGRYRLNPDMNTGPRAPQVQKAQCVWDPNRREIVQKEPALLARVTA